jgi:hypothetical protein
MANESTTQFSIPAYQLAAQSHNNMNYGSREQSFLDGAIDLVTKGIPATLAAAANELSNIVPTVGNLIMGDNSYKITTNREAIMSYDSDLGKYYDDHQLGIDSAGFLVGQIVPGMAGVKVFRAGQGVARAAAAEGRFGTAMAEAFGMKVPLRDKYLTKAISEIGDSGNAFKMTESNLLRAFASGVGQQAMEGAIWTGTVNALMNQSPILDQRDASDLMFDVLIGAGIGGAVGGLFDGIGAISKVKGAVKASEQEVLPWTIAGLGGESKAPLSISDKILRKQQQIDAIPPIAPEFQYAARAGRVAEQTRKTLQLEIRQLTGELAKGDQDVAKIMSRVIGSNSFESNVANLIESVQIARVTKTTGSEKAVDKLVSKVKDVLNLSDDEAAAINKYKTTYVDSLTGKVVSEKPTVLNLADYGKISVSRGVVTAGNHRFKQAATADFADMTGLQAEARYHFLENLKTKPAKPNEWVDIPENDLGLMFKAMKDGYVNVRIGGVEAGTMERLSDLVKQRQATIAAKLVEKKQLSTKEIAKIVNAHEDAVLGIMDKTDSSLWNYRQWLRDTNKTIGDDPWSIPSHFKILTKKEGALDPVNGHLLEGMTIVAQKEKLYEAKALQTVTGILREELPSAKGLHGKAIGPDAGSTFLGAENASYGSWSSFFAYVGQRVSNIATRMKTETTEILTPKLQKLANDLDSAIEWSVLNEKMRNLQQVIGSLMTALHWFFLRAMRYWIRFQFNLQL